MSNTKNLVKLNKKIIFCKKCPRLVNYIHEVAVKKVKRYSNQKYWGKPIPGFGDINARLLMIGLAPAAHGGNRTGRMFTGDSSGDWLAKALYQNGFANKPTSENANDGYRLVNAYVTAAVRCAPPQNTPKREEIASCAEYLQTELKILEKVRVIMCLGRIAFDSCCKLLDIKKERFAHGRLFNFGKYVIICSYHPSRQNTQTRRLSWHQWNAVFKKAKILCG